MTWVLTGAIGLPHRLGEEERREPRPLTRRGHEPIVEHRERGGNWRVESLDDRQRAIPLRITVEEVTWAVNLRRDMARQSPLADQQSVG